MKRTLRILLAGFALCAPMRIHAEEGVTSRPRTVLRAYTNRVQLYNVPLDVPKPGAARVEDLPDPYSPILNTPTFTPNSPPVTIVPPPQRLLREKEPKENWIQVTPSEDAGKAEKKSPSGWGWLADEVLQAGSGDTPEFDEQDEMQTNVVSRSNDPAGTATEQGAETQRGAVSGEPGALGAAAYKPVIVGSVFEEQDKQTAEDREDVVDQNQAIRPDVWTIGQERPFMPYENAVGATTAQYIVDGGRREYRPWSPEDSAGAAAILTRQQMEDLDRRRLLDAQRSPPDRSGPNASLISRLDPGAQPVAGLPDSPVFSTLRSSDIAGGAEGGITLWGGLGGGGDFGAPPSLGFEPAINAPTRDAPLLSPSSSRPLGGLGDEPNMRTRALPW